MRKSRFLSPPVKIWKTAVLAVCALVVCGSAASGTEVSLYSEGGLLTDQNKLRVRVFADITDVANGGALLSAGFVLGYSGGLTNPAVEKNVVDWYFGRPAGLKAHIEPNISQDGEVVFLLGKLDENHPRQGVSGARIFLGSVLFDYSGGSPTAADISLADGHPGSFSDFVTTQGEVLDDKVSFTVAEFVSADTLQLQGLIRALQLLCGMVPGEPVRVAPDDVTGDGKIGIEEPIYWLQQMAR